MSCGPLRTYKRASAAFSGRDYRDYCRTVHFFPHARARITHTEEEKQKKKEKKMKKKEMKKKTTKADARGDYSPPLSNDRMSARARLAIVHRARLRSSA